MMAANSSLPMTTFTYKNDAFNIEVVDVIKLHPEIMNMSYWRDAYGEMEKLCNQFHPYVFGMYRQQQAPKMGPRGPSFSLRG